MFQLILDWFEYYVINQCYQEEDLDSQQGVIDFSLYLRRFQKSQNIYANISQMSQNIDANISQNSQNLYATISTNNHDISCGSDGLQMAWSWMKYLGNLAY